MDVRMNHGGAYRLLGKKVDTARNIQWGSKVWDF